MKKIILVSVAMLCLIAACKKAKTTGHLYVDVNMTHAVTALAVPDSLRTIAGGSLVRAGDTTGFVLLQTGDNSNNRTSKVLDFGEVAPGSYLVDSIHGYAYGDSVYIVLRAMVSTPAFTITAGKDQTLSVSF